MGPISPSLCPRKTADSHLRVIAPGQQFFSKKCCSGGEPLATLFPILPARDLNLRPPAPEANALSFDQLAGYGISSYISKSLANKWLRNVIVCEE